jgi:hypothetical protein
VTTKLCTPFTSTSRNKSKFNCHRFEALAMSDAYSSFILEHVKTINFFCIIFKICLLSTGGNFFEVIKSKLEEKC